MNFHRCLTPREYRALCVVQRLLEEQRYFLDMQIYDLTMEMQEYRTAKEKELTSQLVEFYEQQAKL